MKATSPATSVLDEVTGYVAESSASGLAAACRGWRGWGKRGEASDARTRSRWSRGRLFGCYAGDVGAGVPLPLTADSGL